MFDLHYLIKPADPAAHIFHVTCRIQQPDPQGQIVSLPAWIPGSYLIRDFAKHISGLQAFCDGKAVKLTKLDKDSWLCPPLSGDELVLQYEVYAWDPSVRAARLDNTQGFFNGSSVFLRVHGRENQPCSVELLPPSMPVEGEWRVASSLPRLDAGPHAFGLYQAADYEELIDHPVLMGVFDLVSFEACGVLHELAITGQHMGDLNRITTDLRRICEYQIRFFGEPAPMQYYLFILQLVGEGYGGLEHRASCALIASRNTLPQKTQKKMSDGYREFLGLCSHEYFHTWNIKRIKPAVFTPYDLQKPNYTELLWAFEGITSYYDDLLLTRCGVINAESYLELLARTITRVLRGKGRLYQSVTDSSFYAWTKFYQQDENSPNAIVSYYAKGALVALCLDSEIRRRTDNKASLDNVMRILWQRYGQTGIGLPETAIEDIAQEVSGQNLSDFFEQTLRSTEELPLSETLAYLGVRMELRVPESPRDTGGVRLKLLKPASNESADVNGARADFGASVKLENGMPKLNVLIRDGSAMRGGLSSGDVIVAIDGLQVTMANVENMLALYPPGAKLKVHVFRGDVLKQFDIEMLPAEKNSCYLELDADSDAARSVRKAWLEPGS
jgi:predicted metalloprotease with PDZ domain